MGQFFSSRGCFIEGRNQSWGGCLGCSLSHPGREVRGRWHITCSPSTGVSTGLSPGGEGADVVGKCVDNLG
jgi:hypothetical protein